MIVIAYVVVEICNQSIDEKLAQILSVAILIKRGSGHHISRFFGGCTKKKMLFTEAIGRESQSNEFPELEPVKIAVEELSTVYLPSQNRY